MKHTNRLVGMGFVVILLLLGFVYWFLASSSMPQLEVPPRQYPPNNAYDSLKRVAQDFINASRRASLKKILDKTKSDNDSITPHEHALLVQHLEPYLQEYALFLDQPSKVVLEYDPRFPKLS